MKPNILVIAGHDPSGGAGIHADIEAIQALGGFASTLITALTVQNSRRVTGFQLTDLDLLDRQADALLADYSFSAVKIGMTGSVATVEWIARLLARLPGVPVVLDPVLAAESGGALARENLSDALIDVLAPATTVLTPNLPEAQSLSGEHGVHAAGEALSQRCGQAVLVTGTHDDTDQVSNHLFQPDRHRHWDWPRLPHVYHGSGCSLASAMACLLARGEPLEQATGNAQQWLHQALKNAWRPGGGQYVPNRSPAP
ncbi:bifunctional hydroxymethylpyrimidine kinase/phosphomethylpyrimidine kinase [Alloalcanivorax mobilis]|uniref:bifunctional hydroxymethylpyrimidine kinase/phosphomethylpyrimidine kinase n=1 Tax=Alloalcanivorax mobilis TaxID=2019569 RepID=UPI000B5B117B|nr:hydroxymethylpyrimidine/phosphomethylpyrimidine kinase [Alloalcanivorax mobilis]ASK35172.1 hydroxymethylpyrimidine/phosphomethylpyrimidine kinase [Alcanivorax sp. N3-2A]|tara:strand:+ start:8563 stop:9330 length:768 start_codon:yes stop_codon:yes gene_type:complete